MFIEFSAIKRNKIYFTISKKHFKRMKFNTSFILYLFVSSSKSLIYQSFKFQYKNWNSKGFLINQINSLKCYSCNTLLSSGCTNPLKSSSYFLQNCGNGYYCVQRTTTGVNGNSYMERGCFTDCSSRTNPLYDSNINGYSTSVTNICCQTDGCNHSILLTSNKFTFVFVFILKFIFSLIF